MIINVPVKVKRCMNGNATNNFVANPFRADLIL